MEQESAQELLDIQSHEPLLELRGFSAISRGKAAAFLCSSDLLVEDAVRCEPVSAENSLVTAKNTRN
jgi:hypothetical protein